MRHGLGFTGIVICITTCLGACASGEAPEPVLSSYTPESAQSQGSTASTGIDQDIDLSLFDSAGSLPPAASDKEFHQQVTQWNKVFVTCMNDHGWTQISLADPDTPSVSLDFSGVNGQYAALNADIKACVQKTGPSPSSPSLTSEYAEKTYTARLRLKTCLESQGYTISEPPTRESFTDNFLNARLTWDPLQDASEAHRKGEQPFRSIAELYDLCPWE